GKSRILVACCARLGSKFIGFYRCPAKSPGLPFLAFRQAFTLQSRPGRHRAFTPSYISLSYLPRSQSPLLRWLCGRAMLRQPLTMPPNQGTRSFTIATSAPSLLVLSLRRCFWLGGCAEPSRGAAAAKAPAT